MALMVPTLAAAQTTQSRQGAHTNAATNAPTINGTDAKFETAFITTVNAGDRSFSTNSEWHNLSILMGLPLSTTTSR